MAEIKNPILKHPGFPYQALPGHPQWPKFRKKRVLPKAPGPNPTSESGFKVSGFWVRGFEGQILSAAWNKAVLGPSSILDQVGCDCHRPLKVW